MTAFEMGKLTRTILNVFEEVLYDNGLKKELNQNELRDPIINMLEELVNGLEQKVAEFEKILNLHELKELLNKLNEWILSLSPWSSQPI